MSDVLEWLQEWYLAQCDDGWEHQYGISLESLTISVIGTPLEEKQLDRLQIERSEDDWFQCWIGEGKLGE